MSRSMQRRNSYLRLLNNGKNHLMHVLKGFSTTPRDSLMNWCNIILADSNSSMHTSGKVTVCSNVCRSRCTFSSAVVRMELDKIKASALQAVNKTLELEYNPIFTQNTDFFASERRKWFSAFADIRRRHVHYLTGVPRAVKSFAYESDDDHGVKGDSPYAAEVPVGIEVQVPEDRFHQALSVMVNVRAYFQVTYKVNMTSQPRATNN